MAQDISNKTLATLLVVAIVVSLGGTWLVLSEDTVLGTGLDVRTGVANVTITGLAAISLTDAAIEFGAGTISVNYTYCAIDSNGGLSPGCNTEGGSFAAVNDEFIIENTGNVNVSLTAATGDTPATWIGGSSPAVYYVSSDVEANSCAQGLVTTAAALSTTPVTVCSNLDYVSTQDSVQMDMNLTIPDDAAPGDHSTIVTFTGTAV